jgi:ABC-2 type transport system permease protein
VAIENGVVESGVTKSGAVSRGAFMFSPEARGQYAALAEMRLRMLVNSLRTSRGGFELGARIVRIGFFLLVGAGAGTGLGFAAFGMASDNGIGGLLPLLFWPVLLLWQLVPVMMASFQEPVDLSLLLRFPVSFGSYVLEYLVFGLFDASSILGGFCLAGIWTGLVCARPGLIGWITLAAILFAAFNVLLTRMVFAWLDRWLAQRRTREILGMVFLFLLLGAQLLNPAIYGHNGGHSGGHNGENSRGHSGENSGGNGGSRPDHHSGPPSRENIAKMRQAAKTANHVQSVLPPGLAAGAIRAAERGRGIEAAASLGGLTLYTLAAGSLLALRLRAGYRGENLGEAPKRVAKSDEAGTRRSTFDLAGPIGAVVEKELRYLARSGIMLYSLVAPLVILFVMGHGSGAAFASRYALPLGAAYGFLGLTRLVYNSLGGEGAGIQLYFMSPTPFRTVMLAKNLVQLSLFLVELAVVGTIVFFRFGLPGGEMLAATVCWLLFALPVQLAAGNVLSITMAYRMTLTRVSREQGSAGNGLLSLGIQLLLFGVGAAVFLPLARFGHPRLAAPAFLALAACGVILWLRVLSNADRMAASRREALIGSLARA